MSLMSGFNMSESTAAELWKRAYASTDAIVLPSSFDVGVRPAAARASWASETPYLRLSARVKSAITSARTLWADFVPKKRARAPTWLEAFSRPVAPLARATSVLALNAAQFVYWSMESGMAKSPVL